MDTLVALKIPSILMVIFFIGIVVSTWIALDPIRQIQRKSKYFLVTLVCFIGFVLVAWWDMWVHGCTNINCNKGVASD